MQTATAADQSSSKTPAGGLAMPKRILVALDASDHANWALTETLNIVGAEGKITGIHAYAAVAFGADCVPRLAHERA